MQCSQCRHPNRDEAKFCNQCGAPLVASCPACGAANAPGSKFCGQCGSALAPASSPAVAGAPLAYTPRYLSEKILSSRSALEGERKLVTVLFVDIAESSALAQRFDPERLHQTLSQVLQLIAGAVHRYEGTVNQYLGDGLMALFGAPVALEDHAFRSVQAALTIQETIRGYSAQFEREHGVALQLRIGLNTGPVVVGRIGDDLRMDYTAVGNTTHLAARMQALAAPGDILVTEDVHRVVAAQIRSEPLGPVEVKGQRAPVPVYKVTGRRRWRSRLDIGAEGGLTRLVGRGRELGVLHDRLAQVEAGHGQIVGIVGEAGLGKSRLLHEFHSSLAGRGIGWLEGNCLAHGQALPYGPVLEILRSALHIEEGDNPLQIGEKLRAGVRQADARLESTLPVLESLFGLASADDAIRHLDPKERRRQTLEALRGIVVASGQGRPQVVVCENLHWIDRSSEDSLAFLVGSLASMPVLILTTHRPGYTVRWADTPAYTQIALDRLAGAETQQMLTTLLGREVDDAAAQFIEDKTGGNPLFIEEVVRALDERRLLVRDNGTIRLAGPTQIEFPATIQDIIQARVDRLDDPVKQTIQIAAVIGREFDLRLLSRLTPAPVDVPAHLEILKRLDLVHEARFFPKLEYRFKHAVIQDVVYRSLLGSRRQALHGAVARTIDEPHGELGEEQPAVLAHHYALSEDARRAVPFALAAGDRAARLHANTEAATYYDQALALTRPFAATPDLQRAQIDAALKRASVSGTPEAFARDQTNLEQARTLAASLADEPRMAKVLYWLGRLAYVRGAFQVAAEYAEQSLAIADRLHDEALAALPVNLVGRCYCVMSEYARGGELLARSVEQMKSLGNLTEEATAAGFAGVAFAALGEFDRALAFADHGIRLAQTLQNPYVEAAAYSYRAVVRCYQGEAAEALADCTRARGLAERTGDRLRLYLLQYGEGHAHAMLGNLDRARQTLEGNIAVAKQLGTTALLAWGQALLTMTLLALGQRDAVVPLCQETIQLAEQTHDRLAKALAHRILAEALSPADPRQAEAAVLEAIAIQRDVGSGPELARSHVTYARLLDRARRRDEATRHLAEAVEMFRRMGMARELAAAEPLLRGRRSA
jgi:class 3 adenylate cyclase/tetratricopeptide (TPR) repeat protein